MSTRFSHEEGFTLLEIVISIALLAIVLSIAYGALSNIIRSKQALEDGRDARTIANAILNRFTRELQLAHAGTKILPPRGNTKADVPPKQYLVGESDTLANGENGDSIRFVAMEGGQYLPDGGTHSGLVQIGYRIEEDPDQEQGRDASYFLIRDETPHSRPFDDAYKKTMTFPISNQIVGMRFSYYDAEEDAWHSDWGNEERTGLPTIVKFIVQVRSKRDNIETYSTWVPLERVN